MIKSWFTVMTVKFNTCGHKFGLINFKCNRFKRDKIFHHMSFYFFDFNEREIFDYKFNFFLSFLFDLYNVSMPYKTETLNDLISLSCKIWKYFSQNVWNFISFKLLKPLMQFRKVKDDFVVKFITLVNHKELGEKILLDWMSKKENHFIQG